MTTTLDKLKLRAGSDFILRFQVTGIDAPRTISNALYTILDADTGQVMLQKTLSAGVQVETPPPNTVIAVTLLPADTRDLVGDYEQQLRLTDDLQISAPPVSVGPLELLRAP